MSKKSDALGNDCPSGAKPSRASVGRLSLYLRRLESLLREGTTKVSSGLLGEALGVTDAQVRKDLAYLGNLGHPGIGYSAPELIAAIRRVLGIDRDWAAALVGVGNLARALLRYHGFVERGFRFVALFDADPAKVGQRIEGLEVHPLEAMPSVIAATGAELGVLTVPSEARRAWPRASSRPAFAGLLNFTPARAAFAARRQCRVRGPDRAARTARLSRATQRRRLTRPQRDNHRGVARPNVATTSGGGCPGDLFLDCLRIQLRERSFEIAVSQSPGTSVSCEGFSAATGDSCPS